MKRFAFLLLPISFAIAQTPTVEQAARVGYESINTKDLKKFDTYLSSDALQGRETSYPGEKLAATYIAEHFRSLGLKPIGDNGSYLQHYDVELVKVDDNSNIAVRAGNETKTFSWLKDFMAFGSRDTSVSGGVVFTGFTDNTTPEDKNGVLDGKVVFVFAGPRRALNDTSAVEVRRRGSPFRPNPKAAATIMILDEVGPSSYDRVSSQLASAGISRGRMQLKNAPSPRPVRPTPLLLYASTHVAEAVLAGSGKALNDVRQMAFLDSVFAPVVIKGHDVTVEMKTSTEDRQAENVVGLLEGSDPELKRQVVVFSGHFDHLGVGADGAIYHGADDDGSGTSMVMELAAAFSKNPVRPKRSLLFLTVSGEEKGLLGSSYYTSHPIIPLEETIADFNSDMIGRMDTTHEKTKDVPYTYLIGSDKISTELDSILQVANKETNNIQLDYTYNRPDDPNRFYQRSDHYNFARKGVPIAFFFTGVHADYHRPTDTVDKILFDRMKDIGQLVYDAGWKAANFSRMFSKNVTSTEYR
ncbi:MAG TPA: M28 family peptidase [Bacteroidota bacterium]|nr:M28 family peptidase [Bacteroidota bacterium]